MYYYYDRPQQHDAHVQAYHARRNPFVLMSYSPKVRGRAKQWSSHYSGFRVLETTDGLRPSAVNSKTVVRVIRDTGAVSTGTTERSEGVRARRECGELTDHLNRLHHHRMGWRKITIAEIDAQTNVELQREMIEAIGGLERYAKRAKFVAVHTDETGTLMERATATETIKAVAVQCPSTGRRYMLRVPPRITTARASVAWTFGLDEADYQPTAQS